METQNLILKILEIRYGLESERISNDLLSAIIQTLLNSNEPLSLDDLNTCFEFTSVQKIPGQKMTLDEFMTPIRQYITTKQMLKQVVLQQHIENTKQVAQDEAEEQFFLRAKQKYIDSLEFNEWMGTMFEAKAIADKFWRAMTKVERDALLKHTADIYYREKAHNDPWPTSPKHTATWKPAKPRVAPSSLCDDRAGVSGAGFGVLKFVCAAGEHQRIAMAALSQRLNGRAFVNHAGVV